VAYEFKLPDLGEGLSEGEISRWLVSEGQEIGEDDPLVEVQTDKTTVEIPSPAAGKVTRILVEEGKVVPVGTVLVVIGGEPDGDQPRAEEAPQKEAAGATAHTAPPDGAKARATPLVRRIARELGVDLASLEGTGPQGRITEDDVRGAAGRAPEGRPGATSTVTSEGKLGGLCQTPIVSHPEVAILSVGRIAPRAVVRDGEVATAPVGYVSVTFDHRVVDGARAAAFGLDVIRRLET